MEGSPRSSDLTRTIADEAAAYLDVIDHLESASWFIDQQREAVLDVATVVCEVAHHARCAVDALSRGRLA